MNESKQKNVQAKVHVHLLLGNSITHDECKKLYGGSRLASIINRLRSRGLKIITEMVYEGPDQFARYHLQQVNKKQRI